MTERTVLVRVQQRDRQAIARRLARDGHRVVVTSALIRGRMAKLQLTGRGERGRL